MSALESGASLLGRLFNSARAALLPWWLKWAALAALLAAVYGLGRLQEARHGADAMAEYIGKQGAQTAVIVKRQVQVVTKVETQYRDRIQKIYVQGEQIEKSIPAVLTPDVDRRLPLPAGFVRILDAAWAGAPVGPAVDSDREPASVPPSVVAANETDNATSCLVWRERVFAWRKFYAGQQVAINGKAGEWAAQIELD